MDYRLVFPPSATKTAKSMKGDLSQLISINLSVSSIMLLGAIVQTVLFLLPISKLFSLTPAITILFIRLINALCVTYGYIPNPYLKSAVKKKTTVQFPDLDGKFGSPGSQNIAVLILGAKSNHPLGTFAPDFSKVFGYLTEMTNELETDLKQESGFLGQTGFNRVDANGATEFILISYWRSLEDVHNYALGPTHTKAWKWWDSTIKSHNHIGFMHEVYEADRGMYEGVYVNFQPTLAGATTVLKKNGELVGGEVGDEWISPLLEARGNLRTSNGRRGLEDGEKVAEMFKNDVYA